jgi:hypothetical protein
MQDSRKLAQQKKAAKKIAEIMYASLQKLPADERTIRVEAIKELKVSRSGRGNTPKRVSTPASLRARSRA